MPRKSSIRRPSLIHLLSDKSAVEMIVDAIVEVGKEEAQIRAVPDTVNNAARIRLARHAGLALRLVNLNLIDRAEQHRNMAVDWSTRGRLTELTDTEMAAFDACTKAQTSQQHLKNAVTDHIDSAVELREVNPSRAAEHYMSAAAASFKLGDYVGSGIRIGRAIETLSLDPDNDGKVSLGGEYFDVALVKNVGKQLEELGALVRSLGHPSEAPQHAYRPPRVSVIGQIHGP